MCASWRGSVKRQDPISTKRWTGKPLRAVGIEWDRSGDALVPMVSEVGEGPMAELMERIARRYAVPVKRSDVLSRELECATPGQELPETTTRAISSWIKRKRSFCF